MPDHDDSDDNDPPDRASPPPPPACGQTNSSYFHRSRQKLPVPEFACLLMPAHDERAWHTFRTIPPNTSFLHLSICCLLGTLSLSLTCKNIASPTAPLRLCRFSTSFPMNCVTMKFVTHSKEVCQRLGACSVICVKLWIKAVSWPASCNRSVHQAIHFNWICGNNAHVRTESLFRSTLSITTA